MLNRKIVDTAYATSMLAAPITGVTAAIAEAPQMPVPTPIRVRRSPTMPSQRPISHAATRHTVRDPSITGRDSRPTFAICANDS